MAKVKYVDVTKQIENEEKSFTPTSYKLPEGMKSFRFKEKKTYRLVFMPSRVGKGNKFADPGFVTYQKLYFIHRDIGPKKMAVACSDRNFDKPCYICEQLALARRKATTKEQSDLIFSMEPKERKMYLVLDLDNEEDGVQLMEVAQRKSFGAMLSEELESLPEGDERRNFFHLEGGGIVEVRTSPDTFQGRKFFKPTKINIVGRKKNFKPSKLDEMPCLDKIVWQRSYEEMKKVWTGVAKPEEEEKEEPDDDEDEEEDDSDVDDTAEDMDIKKGTMVKHKRFGECKVVHVSSDGASLRLEDEDGEVHRAVAPKDCKVLEEEEEEDDTEEDDEEEEDSTEEDEEDEDEEEDKPKKKKGKVKKKKPSKKEDDDEDDDWDDDSPLEEDEDDEPRKKKRRK